MVQLCSIEQAVDDVLARLPAHIHMGMPLGLGKPNHFVNALYRRIKGLPERQLTIYTALCLGRPNLGDGLQKRFIEPFVERVFGDYSEFDFLGDLHRDSLPANIRIEQFFMQPGSLLNSAPAQQDTSAAITATPPATSTPPGSIWWRNYWPAAASIPID